MAGRDDTRLLGLHGLFIEARRRDDPAAALLYAEEAAKHAPVPAWAGQAVLEFRCAAGDWGGALERLERNHKGGLIDKAAYRRQRAVLLTAQALAPEDGDRDRAKALALEAVKLAPDLVPAAALAGRLLGEAGELARPRASSRRPGGPIRIPTSPTPMRICGPADSARERLARVEALAAKSPGQCRGARSRWRAPRSTRREFAVARAGARAARRGADPARGGADGRARGDASTATRAARANG